MQEDTQKRLKDEQDAHEKTKTAHSNTLRAQKKAEADLKTKENLLKKAREDRDTAVNERTEKDRQLQKLAKSHAALVEQQGNHESEKAELTKEMARVRAKIGEAIETINADISSIQEEIKNIESNAGANDSVKEACINISATLESMSDSLNEEEKDLVQLQKDANELNREIGTDVSKGRNVIIPNPDIDEDIAEVAD